MWKLTDLTAPTSSSAVQLARSAIRVILERQDLGFWQLPERVSQWTSSEVRAREIRKTSDRMIVLGMGGSSLGGRALAQAAKRWDGAHELEFIDNVDADRFWKILKSHKDLNATHWVLISKSGTTIETLTMVEFIDQYLRTGGYRKIASQATVISESTDNPLTRWARKEGIPCLEIPKDVGGRYSLLTPVGLLPAAFYGIDIQRMRAGAQWALQQEEMVAEIVAQTLLSFERQEWVTFFWSYADGLRDFGYWTQQLWAESLGKTKDLQGRDAPRVSTPVACIGASDQHSILQQVMDGYRDKFVFFIRVNESERAGPVLERGLFEGQQLMLGKTMGDLFKAEAIATQRALKERNVQSLTLQADVLDEAAMGALAMLFELAVAALGQALNIDAFDQPGVEVGKKIARKILEDQA